MPVCTPELMRHTKICPTLPRLVLHWSPISATVPPSSIIDSAPRTPALTQSCRLPVLESATLLELPMDLMRRRSRPFLSVKSQSVRRYLGRLLPLRTLWCVPASRSLRYLASSSFPS